MKKLCQYCRKVHDKKYDCGMKPKKMRPKGSRTSKDKLRSTNRWTQTSRRIRDRDNNLCQLCLLDNTLTYDELSVHHIIPLEEDESLAFEEKNLITLCGRHHEAAEAGEVDRSILFDIAGRNSTPL